MNSETEAFQLGELIDKHGRDGWLDPLVEKLGPYIQLQLGDVANLLEVLAKYSLSSLRYTSCTNV